MAEKEVVEIVSLMNESGVPACPIHDVGEVVDDPHVSEAREMVVEVDQPGLGRIRVLGNPVKMSETRPTPRGPAPALGEDTGEVLEELLDLDGAQVSALRRKGVI
jgi:crotonobetainyl-CoA:carnitine CoA-transferase CaiB-like acyl-CoA transferase